MFSTLFGWEIYQLTLLNFEEYFWLKVKTAYVYLSHGGTTTPQVELLLTKIKFIYSRFFGLENPIMLIIFMIISINFIVYLVYLFFKSKNVILKGYILFFVLSIVSWALFVDRVYLRHLLPYILLSKPIFIKFFVDVYNFSKSKYNPIFCIFKYTTIFIIFILIFISAHNILVSEYNGYQYNKVALDKQKEFIQDISKVVSKNSRIGYWDWWRAPEISYFLDNEFIDLNGLYTITIYNEKRMIPEFIIVSPYQIFYDFNSIKELSIYTEDLLLASCISAKYCYYLYKSRSNCSEIHTPIVWISNKASLKFFSETDVELEIQIELLSFYKVREIIIYINDKNLFKQKVPPDTTEIRFVGKFEPGWNIMRFYTSDGCQRPYDIKELNSPDKRCISFGFKNIIINRKTS
ncbi:MAG: hypothetical protein QXF06_00235 [Archaeoglobaceae archaeon]